MTKESFWSSVTLTGNNTSIKKAAARTPFWSSVTLTGNETAKCLHAKRHIERQVLPAPGNNKLLWVKHDFLSQTLGIFF